jgi:hypothetical protein
VKGFYSRCPIFYNELKMRENWNNQAGALVYTNETRPGAAWAPWIHQTLAAPFLC